MHARSLPTSSFDGPSASKAMHPLTLRFHSEELEEQLVFHRWGDQTSWWCMAAMVSLLPASTAMFSFIEGASSFELFLFLACCLITLVFLGSYHVAAIGPSSASKRVVGEVLLAQRLFTVIVLITNLIHVLSVEPAAHTGEFSLNPVANAAFLSLAIVLCYIQHGRFYLKLAGGLGPATAHIIAPIWGIGRWNEAKLMIAASMLGTVCGYALETMLRKSFLVEQNRAQMAAANAKADARLNHVVKGLCGGASGILKTIMPELQHGGSHGLRKVGQREVRLVKDVLDMLSQAAGWCHKRQFFVQLESSTYTTQRAPFDVEQMAHDLVGELGSVSVEASTVVIDAIVLRLLLEEGMSNARKYRKLGAPIRIQMRLEGPEAVRGGKKPTGAEPSPGNAGDKEAGEPGCWLHMEMINVNHKHVPRMTEEECAAVLQPETKGRVCSSMSDGLGLDTAAKAASAAGGSVWLTTFLNEANEACTVLHARLPASEAGTAQAEDWGSFTQRHAHPHGAAAWSVDSPAPSFGSIKEESSVGRVMPTDNESCGATGAMDKGGTARSSVLAMAGMPPKPAPPVSTHQLLCFGLDDDALLRTTHEIMFETFLGADMACSRSLGGSLEEAEAFVDVALGRSSLDLTPRAVHGYATNPLSRARAVLLTLSS
jgi:hypothetical protein